MFRGIKRNIFTAVLEILSIASVTLVLYLNLNLAGDVRLSLTEGARKTTGGYDLFLESPDGDAVSLSALSSLPQDSLLPYSSRLCMQGNIPGINYYACLFVDTEVITERGMVTVTEGRLPGNENEALILVTKTGNAALAPGNTVSVTEDDGTTHDLTICGVLSGFPLESNARPDVLELVIPRGNAPSAQRVYVDSHLAGTNRENLQDRFPDLRVNGLLDEADVREEIEGFSRVLLLITGLIVLLSGFLLATISGNRTEARRGDYSIFRSVGACRRQWAALLFWGNGTYALLGSLCGIPLGEIVRGLIISRYYEVTAQKLPFPVRNALLAFAFSLCFELVFTAISAFGIGRGTIRHSLFEKDTCAYKLKKSHLCAGAVLFFGSMIAYAANTACNVFVNEIVLLSALFGSTLLLPWAVFGINRALKFLSRNGRSGIPSFAMTRIAAGKTNVASIRLLTAALALSSVFLFAVSSVDLFFERYAKKYDYDLYVSHVGVNEEVFDLILEQPFTESILLEYNTRTRVTLNDSSRPDEVRFYKIGGYVTGIDLLGVDADALTPGHVVIDSLFAKIHRLRVGDTVRFRFEDAGGATRAFEIVGFCDSSIHNTDRKSVVLGDEDYFAVFGKEPGRVDITLAPGYSKEEVLTSLQYLSYLRISSDVRVGLNSEYLDVELSRTKAALKAFSVLPLLVTVMSVVGLINNQCLSFRRNRREYAVLYSVAMSKRQIYRTLILESLLIFLFGALFGALLSVYLLYVLRDILFVLICYIPIKINVTLITAVLAGTGAVILPVTLLPYASVLRMNVADEVKKDA